MKPKEQQIPRHVGFILDGNRRWARAKGLPTFEGHRKGYDNLKTIAEKAFVSGVEYVSAYIFSTENWNRSPAEVQYLMKLALRILTNEVQAMHKKGIKVVWLGTTERLDKKILEAIKAAEELTKHNTTGTLCLCFNYGGRQELVDATKQIIQSGMSLDDISVKTLEKALYAPGVPPVDLVIRTSGELRLSGFMLWRAAYAELWFTQKHWPDFTQADLEQALSDYALRQRRYGK